MDPNATLAQLRAWASWVTSESTRGVSAMELQAAERFQDLDEWLSNGGFLPEEWRIGATWERFTER